MSHVFLADEKAIEHKLAELKQKTYLPESLLNLVAAVTKQLLATECSMHQTEADKSTVPASILNSLPDTNRHAQGMVLLPREHFSFDKKLAEAVCSELLTSLPVCAPELESCGKELARALELGEYSLEAACRAIMEEAAPTAATKESYFTRWEKEHPHAPNFFRFVAQTALMPSAINTANELAQHHDADAAWPHGYCPICGSLPLMGRLKGTTGVRMHSCSFCHFEYRVPRIGCPFCLTTSPEESHFYSSEDEPGYLIYTCAVCDNYIKIADFRKFDRPYIPLLDDLSSLILDLHARKEGHKRPTASSWGF